MNVSRRHFKSHPLKSAAILFAFVLPVCFTGAIQAQERHTLTIQEAIQIADRENIGLKQSLNKVSSGRLAARQSEENFLPNLSASLSGSKELFKSYDPLTDKTSGQTSRMLNASVSSNVNIFNGFGDAASLKRDRLLYKALGKSSQRQRQSVIFQTISQFLQTVLSKAFIGIEKENLAAEQKQLDQIEEFRKAGNRSLADVLQQKADIAKAELGLLEASRNYETAKLQLFQILGQEPPDHTEIVSPNVDSLLAVLTAQHPEHLTGETLGLRPDVISQEMQIKAVKEQVWVNKSGYWPSVSFSVNGGSNYRSSNKFGSFSDQLLNFNPYVSAGISVSIPLFDRFRTQNNVENAEIQVSNQLLGLKDLTLGATYEIQKALLDYKTALQQRAAAKSQLKYAKEALEISETRYRVGSLTYVELAQVRAKYLTASYDYAQTNHNLLIKGMAIYFYRGDMNPILSLLK